MTPAAALVAALRATIAALENDDLEAAALASTETTAAVAALERDGRSLDGKTLEEARALHAACALAADQRQSKVVAALLQSATHRRASDAYGSSF